MFSSVVSSGRPQKLLELSFDRLERGLSRGGRVGADNVRGVRAVAVLSRAVLDDAASMLAENLGIRYDVIPYSPRSSRQRTAPGSFCGASGRHTEENIQARLRGVILMALSNKLVRCCSRRAQERTRGRLLHLVMATVRRAAVISDGRRRWCIDWPAGSIATRKIIPIASITKAPSAELRPDQTDQDSLPP